MVDEGSAARVSAWFIRRSTMSRWEAPSATDCAVCPFWGKNGEKMSQHRMEDIVVVFLNLTVAVLCHSISSGWTLK